MRRTALVLSIVSWVFATACATPVVEPVDVQPVVPGRGEQVVVNQSMLIIDSSGSISRHKQFPGEKALVQSLVSAMPAGKYDAGAIEFGGVKRDIHPLGALDRAKLGSYAGGIKYLNEGTPLDRVLNEAGAALRGMSDHAAITVVSDGLPTDVIGQPVPEQRVLDAAQAAAKGYKGKLCIYTIQVGDDPSGTAFLQKLSKVTGCGSAHAASSLNSAAALQGLQREVYLGAAATTAAAAPLDSDGDGVPDDKDQCPGTPKGAHVDARGCWEIEGLKFATGSAEIEPAAARRLEADVVPVLKRNPEVRVRIDGHTDSRGNAASNQKLSERRAESVRNFLVKHGIKASRLEARGFGETQPIAPNDTAENLLKNRRTELTVISQ
jgi:OmpA-OmpF porin, OOP family